MPVVMGFETFLEAPERLSEMESPGLHLKIDPAIQQRE